MIDTPKINPVFAGHPMRRADPLREPGADFICVDCGLPILFGEVDSLGFTEHGLNHAYQRLVGKGCQEPGWVRERSFNDLMLGRVGR